MKNKAMIMGLTMMAGVGVYGATQEVSACGAGVTEFKVTANLNVRPEPNTSKSPIGKYSKGQIIVPVDGENGWAKVEYKGKTGWVSMDYLEKMPDKCIPESEDSIKVINKRVSVTADVLNLRERPSTQSAVLGKFSNGKKLTALKQVGEWLYVEDGHVNGWVHSSYVKDISESNNSQAPENNNTSSNEKWDGVISISGGTLNVRMGAGTTYSVKGSLKNGEKVRVLSEKKDKQGNAWLYVSFKKSGRTDFGYVAKQYVKVDNGVTEEKPSVPPTTEEKPSVPPTTENKPSTDVESNKPSVDESIESEDTSDLTGEVYDEETGKLIWLERTVRVPESTTLEVRTLPSENAPMITQLVKDAKVFVAGESKSNPGWYKISGVDHNGNEFNGWAISTYIY